ncbi:Uncharacterised protein [Prevotella denticola]|uniref:Uncharacterized protein n=1 Tax=Prevotella denticola TaxID=28129 RepID=A0A379EBT2_9BACT|nr:Uncharacterised protein [Prevotella denticola]
MQPVDRLISKHDFPRRLSGHLRWKFVCKFVSYRHCCHAIIDYKQLII